MRIGRFSLRVAGGLILAALATGCASAASHHVLPKPTVAVTSNPCKVAAELVNRGLLTLAEGRYEALLSPPAGGNVPHCAVVGLQAVATARQTADRLAALGDHAAASGDFSQARSYYTSAQSEDHGNQAAVAGLRKLNRQGPNGIRQARDSWYQIVDNTLVPIGQFFLWLFAVCAGVYVLWLLTKVVAGLIRLPELPSRQGQLKVLAGVALLFAVAAAAVSAASGSSSRPHRWATGGSWLVFLGIACGFALAGWVMAVWSLRSGSGIRLTVDEVGGDADWAQAALAARLESLGGDEPRGLEIQQGTDVTALKDVVTLLPGGSMLSALMSFLLASVPSAPWRVVVTIADGEKLLVTLHRNRRLVATVSASPASLFFPAVASGANLGRTTSYTAAIDKSAMLTVAAVIILVEVANCDQNSPLRAGLNGATQWQSVAGQVLASEQGFSGDEELTKALLDHALATDSGNMAAQVNKLILNGRRATDPGKRKEFAREIDKLAQDLIPSRYRLVMFRALYSSATGWLNVYLDGRQPDYWDKARDSTVLLGRMINIYGELIAGMRAATYRLREYLESAKPDNADVSKLVIIPADWKNDGMPNAGVTYDEACLAAEKGDFPAALTQLTRAVIDNDLKIWARDDPSFNQLRNHDPEKFFAIVGDSPAQSFVELSPISEYQKQLADIGVHDASDVCSMTITDAQQELFAKAVGVSQLVVARWRDIAILGTINSDPPDLAQLDLLIAANVDSITKLRARTANTEDIETLHAELERKSAGRQVTLPTREDLRRWSLRSPAPGIW